MVIGTPESGEVVDMHLSRVWRSRFRGLASWRRATRTHVKWVARVNALQLIPSGPGFRTEPNLRAFTSLMYLAKRRLAIVSPYFVRTVVPGCYHYGYYRGVEVRLYVSEVSDQFMVDRAQSCYYQALLDAGVRDSPVPGA